MCNTLASSQSTAKTRALLSDQGTAIWRNFFSIFKLHEDSFNLKDDCDNTALPTNLASLTLPKRMLKRRASEQFIDLLRKLSKLCFSEEDVNYGC
jgi:hypothetical protein